MFLGLITTVTIFMCLASVMPMTHFGVWWIRGGDFPRVQFTVVLILNVFLILFFLEYQAGFPLALLVISGLCLCYQLWWIIPYTSIYPCEVARVAPTKKNTHSVRFLSANVLQTNQNYSHLIDLIKKYNPDVVITLETNKWWQDKLCAIHEQYPHRIKCPLENLYGMHVFSRFAFGDSQIKFLIEDDVPSIHARIFLPSGEAFNLHVLHPAPPSPVENISSSERDAELIITAREIAKTNTPVIVAGDLNDVAWSKTTRLFRHLSGLKDPRIGRGMFNTFHASYWFIRWPLDHLFHSEHFKLVQLKRLKLKGSDHFSLLTELHLSEPDTAFNNTTPPNSRESQLINTRLEEQKLS